MSFNNRKIRSKKCSSVQKSLTAIYEINTVQKYFTSLNEAKADTSFETCSFISEGTFRLFWRISMICLYLNTNLSSVFTYAESYRFCTHHERLKLTIYISKNCHAPDIIKISNGTSLSLSLMLDQLWHEDLRAFLKHHFPKKMEKVTQFSYLEINIILHDLFLICVSIFSLCSKFPL